MYQALFCRFNSVLGDEDWYFDNAYMNTFAEKYLKFGVWDADVS
jgi:hypothetical protein